MFFLHIEKKINYKKLHIEKKHIIEITYIKNSYISRHKKATRINR